MVYVASSFGRRWTYLAVAMCLLSVGTLWLWLPRAAHRRFVRGSYRRSALYYAILRLARFEPLTRGAIDVSLAACALAGEDWDRALAILDGVPISSLDGSARAAWLNNRAYALVRSGKDIPGALEYSEEAIELRPDVAGFRHTRGLALLEIGRVDEAISELDALWSELSQDDRRSFLEAERCYDLGMAWRHKGEGDYARDYFERAQRAAPESRWAARAGRHLDGPRQAAVLAEFL